MEFEKFKKIARLNREIIVTEKIDGTNSCVAITEDGEMFVGSRNRWITPDDDNFGFAKWAQVWKDELLKLGPGRHYGEWWGNGIQRGYGLGVKHFSLFNTSRWEKENPPACCGIVPVIYQGKFSTDEVETCLDELRDMGSFASPGFMNPEGIVIFHTASNALFKVTLENDESPKTLIK